MNRMSFGGLQLPYAVIVCWFRVNTDVGEYITLSQIIWSIKYSSLSFVNGTAAD